MQKYRDIGEKKLVDSKDVKVFGIDKEKQKVSLSMKL